MGEEIVEEPTEEKVEESQKEEKSVPEKTTFSEEEMPKTGLLAALGIATEEIRKSVLLTTIVVLCLVGLVAIVIKELWLFQRKRNK